MTISTCRQRSRRSQCCRHGSSTAPAYVSTLRSKFSPRNAPNDSSADNKYVRLHPREGTAPRPSWGLLSRTPCSSPHQGSALRPSWELSIPDPVLSPTGALSLTQLGTFIPRPRVQVPPGLCPRPSWGTYILRPRVQALPGQQGSVPQPSWGTFTPDPVFNFKPTRAPWLSLDAAGGLS